MRATRRELASMRLDLPYRPESQSVARRALRDLGDVLDPDEVERLELCISELISNSIRHSGRDESIRLEMRVTDQAIRVEVTDSGPGLTLKSMSAEGFGLRILDRLASDWGTSKRNGAGVWFEIER